MIRKIKVSYLRIGMFVNNLAQFWPKHPFYNNNFIIKSELGIRRIIASGAKVIEIDTEQGHDIELEQRNPKNENLRETLNKNYKSSTNKVSATQEAQHAKIAFSEAGLVINDMMSDVKMGKNIQMEAVNPIINKMSESILRNENALLGLTRIRMMDKYTFEHSVSLSVLLMSFGKSLKMDHETIKELGVGGLLHDIGKTLTPDEILNKPGKLTSAEFVIMRNHVVDSRKILEKTKGISQIALDIAALHHERFDGTGYPTGLKGDEISLYGQMGAIVDVYDALTANRCYHEGKTPSTVLKLLVKWGGGHFNPALVQKFIQSIGIYPSGSLVLLTNRHLAKVIDVSDSLLKPIVETFLDTRERTYIPQVIINLNETDNIKIISAESHKTWNIEL